MGFINPLWLAAGLLAIAVIMLHTLRRERIEVPSLILWRQLARRANAQPRLAPPRVSLLLVLQVLTVLAFAAALAQPLLGAFDGRPAHRIYLLDSSASMGTKDIVPSRFEAAKAALIDDLARLAEGARASVIVVADTPRYVVARQADARAIADAVEDIVLIEGEAQWQAVADRLGAVLRNDEANTILALTDVDASQLAIDFPEAAFEQRSFGSGDTPNASLRATISLVDAEKRQWRIAGEVELAGGSTLPSAVQVEFVPVGETRPLEWASIALDAASFSADLTLPSDGAIRLSLPTDAAAFDDGVAFVLRSMPERTRGLYIGPGNAPLEQALLATGRVDLVASQSLPPDASSYDLVIVENVALATLPATNQLLVGTAREAAGETPARAEGLIATDWEAQHPLSTDIDWSRLEPTEGLAFAPMPGAATVLAAADVPLIEARTTPSGRQVRLAFDPQQAPWAKSPDFAVLVNNIVDYLNPAPAVGASACLVGVPCAIAPNALSAPVLGQDGKVAWNPIAAEWIPDSAALSFVPPRAGLYTHAGRVVAANAPAGETLGPVPPSSTRDVPAPFDLVPVLVVAGLLLMLAELLVYARGKDRPLSARALSRGVPGAASRWGQIGLRLAAIAAAIAALVAVPLPVPDVATDVVVVASVGAEAGECELFTGRRAGLVAVAGTPSVLHDTDCLPAGTSGATSDGDDISSALELAAAMVRTGREGRVALATTAGGGRDVLPPAIPVDVLPSPTLPADTYVGAIDLPTQIFAGDPVPVIAHIHAAGAETTSLTLSVDGAVVSEQDVDLVAGSNRIDAELPSLVAGERRIEVTLALMGDAEPANNSNAAIANVRPLPPVAIVTSVADEGERFAEALRMQGIETRILRPRDAPFSLEGWLDYAGVVLLNVPAIDLDTQQQDQLESFVRDFGRGLVLLGGENTFGPGGYFQTPLERLSPLSSRVPDDLPAAALVFVLDRSGSMQAVVGDATRLDIARQATISAVELLNPESQVGVVAFDTEPQVILPLQERKDQAALVAALERLSPGGGTAIFPGLAEGLNQMELADSPTRHIIVMSDGLSQPGNLDALGERARQLNVTISAVAIGSGADVGKLEKLAREGGGAFHQTQDFRALPSILSQEAMMLATDALKTGTREVFWLDRDASFLAGLPDSMPPIDSYVLTSSKPEAKLHVATRDDKGETVPLLASWRYGNGTVVAFATHGAGPGAARWLGLPQYPRLWAQALRQSMSLDGAPGLSLTLSREADDVTAIVRAFDKAGQPEVGLSLTADLSLDGNSIATLPFAPVAPGEYRARFASLTPGDYRVSVSGAETSASAAIALAYPARLEFARADREGLEHLTAMTGGLVRTDVPQSGLSWQLAPVWRPWLVLALAAFLFDLILRYAPRLIGIPARRAQTAGVPA